MDSGKWISPVVLLALAEVKNSLLGAPQPNIIASEVPMKPLRRQIKIERPKREKLTREETLKRVKAFAKRKEKLIAAIREGSH